MSTVFSMNGFGVTSWFTALYEVPGHGEIWKRCRSGDPEIVEPGSTGNPLGFSAKSVGLLLTRACSSA